jgi:hypothetical protein
MEFAARDSWLSSSYDEFRFRAVNRRVDHRNYGWISDRQSRMQCSSKRTRRWTPKTHNVAERSEPKGI